LPLRDLIENILFIEEKKMEEDKQSEILIFRELTDKSD